MYFNDDHRGFVTMDAFEWLGFKYRKRKKLLFDGTSKLLKMPSEVLYTHTNNQQLVTGYKQWRVL